MQSINVSFIGGGFYEGILGFLLIGYSIGISIGIPIGIPIGILIGILFQLDPIGIPIGILISNWNSNWIQLDFFVRVSKGFCVFFKFLLLPILGKKRNRMITSLWTEKHRTTVPYFYAIHNSNFQIYVKKTRLLANVNLHFENYVFVETRLSTIRITKFEIFHAEISINHCGRRPYSNLSIVAHSQETANWEKTTSLPK